MIGEIEKNTSPSLYQPGQDVRDFTAAVRTDYIQGELILNKPFFELNDRSVLDDENRGQMMFNAFVDTSDTDPNEAWKWKGTRSMARNKGIAFHAQLTASYILPLFVAQNDDDEEDRDFSEMMRYVIEWMASPTNSNYQSSFLQMVFGMITNPVTYLGAEYCEVMQKVKERQPDGSVQTKEIMDEILSGFQCPIYSSSQVLITNAFERNIQKQRRIIKRRYVEKSELEAKYDKHPNWEYVQPGIKSVYNPLDELFYDVFDAEHPTLVAEDTVMTRRDDSEVCFLGGVYMGEDNVDDNMMRHRDNRGAPKYDVVPFGFHRIGEHFFYYKSMMNSMGWDNMLYDAMSEIVMNRAILEVDTPIAITGTDEIDSEVIFPKSVVAFENPDVKINRLLPDANVSNGFAALRETEKSINEGSLNDTVSGQLPDANQKAFSVAQAQANAKKLIGTVGKSLGESVCMYGDLMKDIALNNIMSPQVIEDLSGESLTEGLVLRYKNLTLPNKAERGKSVSKNIKFDPSYLGMEVDDDEKESMEMEHLEDIGYPDNDSSFIMINPEVAARYKYLTRVDPEEMFAKNQEYWQTILLNLKTTLAMDPYTDQEGLTKELMYAFFQSRGSDFVKKASETLPAPAQNGQQNNGQGGQNGNSLGAMFNNKALSTVATGAASGM